MLVLSINEKQEEGWITTNRCCARLQSFR